MSMRWSLPVYSRFTLIAGFALTFAAFACDVSAVANSTSADVPATEDQASTPADETVNATPTAQIIVVTATPEETPPSEETSTDLTILVVTDSLLPGRSDFSSGERMSAFFDEQNIEHDTWDTLEDGYPSARKLGEYSLVFWSNGNDCCDSPEAEATDLIMSYIDNGGWLFIDGGAIGYAWANSRFMRDYLHADHAGYSPQADVVPTDHPIGDGLSGQIRFTETPYVPDAVRARDGAQIVLERGNNSAQQGLPSMLAYEDDKTRIVYAVFPVYLLPKEEFERLLLNSVEWFSR